MVFNGGCILQTLVSGGYVSQVSFRNWLVKGKANVTKEIVLIVPYACTVSDTTILGQDKHTQNMPTLKIFYQIVNI